ncbi:MAG TPA: DNA-deoxyinosine glycosylase [Steroidobacteraceae bacterium]|jgi:hypoxanthine-DNA glycosylase|nr:DNA-deoxyinosine glycosylase [Steroidobacteraceae bacterium]
MTHVTAFPPIMGVRPRILVLGSLPGVASVRAGQYYAHPRNLFWPIMGALFDAPPSLPYAQRMRALESAGVCVWDVLAEATRPGSADAAIDPATARAHDIRGLLLRHRGVQLVAFNGAAAARLYRQLVLPTLPPARVASLRHVTLPSTSPAHAALDAAAKLRAWRRALRSSGSDPASGSAARRRRTPPRPPARTPQRKTSGRLPR